MWQQLTALARAHASGSIDSTEFMLRLAGTVCAYSPQMRLEFTTLIVNAILNRRTIIGGEG